MKSMILIDFFDMSTLEGRMFSLLALSHSLFGWTKDFLSPSRNH